MKASGDLEDRLGPMHDRVTHGGPQVFTSNINKSSNPGDYEAMKINVRPF